jgi:predicted nucleotidyltransferase
MKVQKKILTAELLQDIVRRIVAAVQPEKIILFGSAARGEMGPDSDLDLLVIKSCGHRRRTATKVERSLIGIGVPTDVIVATPDDIDRYKDTIGFIYRPALREGKTIYAA